MTRTTGMTRFFRAASMAFFVWPLLAGGAATTADAVPRNVCFRGVNLSGAEYGDLTADYGTGYVYPSEATIRYFARNGMNTIRLPFRWERLQPALKGELDADELQHLNDTIALIRKYRMTTVLDPHGYAVYGDKQIGSDDVSTLDFADFWSRLAVEFSNQKDVIFGLMNEPHDMPATRWLAAANAAIRGIRAAGANNLILVPGTNWTGAHSWETEMDGGANGPTMLGVRDPRDNIAFEVHQYLDDDFSGTHDSCPRSADAVAAIDRMTDWLRANRQRGFLGEFGVSQSKECLAGLKQMMDAVDTGSDVWLGWTYWAAGDWWPESEPLNVQPHESRERRQMSVIGPAARKARGTSAGCAVVTE